MRTYPNTDLHSFIYESEKFKKNITHIARSIVTGIEVGKHEQFIKQCGIPMGVESQYLVQGCLTKNSQTPTFLNEQKIDIIAVQVYYWAESIMQSIYKIACRELEKEVIESFEEFMLWVDRNRDRLLMKVACSRRGIESNVQPFSEEDALYVMEISLCRSKGIQEALLMILDSFHKELPDTLVGDWCSMSKKYPISEG
ncbi:hypothetical protein KW882_01495 [Vibrio parahaemolyticus]